MKSAAVPQVQKIVELLTSYMPLRKKNSEETQAMLDEEFTTEAFDAWYANDGAEIRKLEENIVEAAQETLQELDDAKHPANDRIYRHLQTLQSMHRIQMCSTEEINSYISSLTMWLGNHA